MLTITSVNRHEYFFSSGQRNETKVIDIHPLVLSSYKLDNFVSNYSDVIAKFLVWYKCAANNCVLVDNALSEQFSSKPLNVRYLFPPSSNP